MRKRAQQRFGLPAALTGHASSDMGYKPLGGLGPLIPSDHRSDRNVTMGALLIGGLSGAMPGHTVQISVSVDCREHTSVFIAGRGADQRLLQQIADIGAGERFHAEGSIDQYSQQLESVFRRLGGTRPVELVE